ncbi:hypothetical protein KR222_006389 [Zaprionus bogoriensis]|nr:hypothetical protein KR222_006389 [Zaprionus bogoriensis]
MNYICVRFVILLGMILQGQALVHYVKLEKGENGCKTTDGKELKVGETADDPNVCGVFVCMDTNGDTLIHYCQIPASFEYCSSDGVSTVTPFPECCWKCVDYVACGSTPGESGAPANPPQPAPSTAEPQGT